MRNNKTIKYLTGSFFLVWITTGLFFLVSTARGEEKKLDYKNQPVVDSDLDGLTDLGEKEIFKTDPLNPDSDGDGILDGAEVIGKTDPLDATSPSAKEIITNRSYYIQKETPWAWYLTRSSALLGFFLLWISIFLGLSIKTPILNRIIKPFYSFNIHCWISLQALFFALLHGVSLLFDKYINLNFLNVFVPFYPLTEDQGSLISSDFLALGIIGFYIMIILVATSYFRKYVPFYLWRAVHFLNVGLFVLVIIHALYLGTDLKNDGIARNIFIWSNAFLAFLFLVNLLSRLFKTIFHRNREMVNTQTLQ